MKSTVSLVAIAAALVAFVEAIPVRHLGNGQDVFNPPNPPFNNNHDNPDAPKGMGIGVRYWQGEPEVLLVTPPYNHNRAPNEQKGPQFTRGTAKHGEWPHDTIAREFWEESGLRGEVDLDNVYVHHKNNKEVFHARLLKVPYGQEKEDTIDSGGRIHNWLKPHEVEDHLERPEMKKAWNHLKDYIRRR